MTVPTDPARPTRAGQAPSGGADVSWAAAPASVVTRGETRESNGVAQRLSEVRERIADAARAAGRAPGSVTLVAVSKFFGAPHVLTAMRAGQVDFGESRAQELSAKAEAVRVSPIHDGRGAKDVRWHFVGRLQRNKVAQVVGLACMVHSVDRLELAEALAARASSAGLLQRVLVQVNVGEDAAKAGVPVERAADLVARVRELPGLACEGLMTVPALGPDPRPAFAGLRRLRDQLRARFPEVGHLSMGMSSDIEAAVAEGATLVRVGQAVFGPRPARPAGPMPRSAPV